MSAEAAPWPSTIDAVVDATEAVEYYTSVADHNGMKLDEFPTLAPPFPCFWIETARPALLRVGDKITSNEQAPLEWGALFHGVKTASGFHVKIDFGVRRASPPLLAFPSLSTTIKLDAQGLALKWASGMHLALHVRSDVPQEAARSDAIEMTPLLGGLLFAISLMHCKNVTLRVESPNAYLSRAGERRGHPPLLRYHVLEIEPMKKVLRAEGKVETTGLKTALHICRGHFKDYRQSGLFGKHKGIFWWEMTARGSSEAGIIDKDYAIGAPAHAP